jgi:predicted enzyme related to lactoylglutathione lyase
MERVTGIGGVFFRSEDPVALSHWYRDHLGVHAADDATVWQQEQGPTIFSPVDAEATYFFSGPDQAVMLNFRVRDIDAMVAQLRAMGAAVDGEIEIEQGAGRFAWVTDPEGNKVQLWEPEGPA